METVAIETAKETLFSVLSRTANEINLAWCFKDDLKKLQAQLNRLNLVANGAESSQAPSTNPLVRDWIRDIKNIAYDADDLLDEYSYEILRRKLFRSKIRSYFFFSCASPLLFRIHVAHKVMDMKKSIDEAYKQARELGIRAVNLTDPHQRGVPARQRVDERLQFTREYVDATELIGRDADERSIVEMMFNSCGAREDLPVVVIVGIAGLGKTALSKRILNGEYTKQCFDVRIWVCVSRDFEVTGQYGVLSKMEKYVLEGSSDVPTECNDLPRKLNGKRYLLVLDDVWDTMELPVWESFKCILKDMHGSSGSTILMTTRNKEVAGRMQTKTSDNFVYELEGLRKEDGWSLFYKHVRGSIIPPHLKERAERMVEKCRGVPLAIRVLAGTIRTSGFDNLQKMDDSEIWLDDKGEILPALRLSFDYLPSVEVKRCFAYCAIFPEDAVIDKENLIQLWVAQGLISPPRNSLRHKVLLEGIGHKYLNILLNNSLIQDVVWNEYGKIVKCKMHDAVLALAQHVSREEWLMLNTTDTNYDLQEETGFKETRHLYLAYKQTTMHHLKPITKKLRTVVITAFEGLSISTLNCVLDHVNRVRVLCLVGIGMTELPDVIGSFKHLRYLDVSGNHGIKKIPDAITNLFCLQTLRCAGCHIDLTFPSGWTKLVNLRHLVTYPGITITEGMNRLKFLQTLPFLDLDGNSGKLNELGPLTDLRGELHISHLEHVKTQEEAREANLREKPNLDSLRLNWYSNNCNNVDAELVLEAMQPHPNLKEFFLAHFVGEKLPTWLTGEAQVEAPIRRGSVLPNIKYLDIFGCNSLTSIVLNSLPSLVHLSIKYCMALSYVSFTKPLHNLKKLNIRWCYPLCSGIIGLENLPHLKTLRLGGYVRLERFPIEENIILPASLKKLYLDGWGKVNSLLTQFQQCTNLESLGLYAFCGLEELPGWIEKFTCLRELELENLPNLKCLPSENVLLRLNKLNAYNCVILAEKCKEPDGTEWPKISHIPHVRIF